MRRPPPPRHGFTLIELLVVISIIALLIAMLLPALAQARLAAQGTACMANLHSLGQAMLNYDVDYGGIPRANYDASDGDWVKHLSPYMSGASQPAYLANKGWQHDPVYQCPAAGPNQSGTISVSYGMNYLMDVNTGNPSDKCPVYINATDTPGNPNPMYGRPANSLIPLRLVPQRGRRRHIPLIHADPPAPGAATLQHPDPDGQVALHPNVCRGR